MAVGKAINIRRVELGLSRNDLRDRSGLSYPYLAEIEKGVKSPSSRSLEAISEALEIRPHELLARAESLLLESSSDSFEMAPLLLPSASSAPTGSSRWFGAAPSSAAPPDRPRRRRAPAANSAPQPTLTEERVREIVREELRRAIGDGTT